MKKLIPFLFVMFVLAMTGCGDKDKDATPSAGTSELVITADGKTVTFPAGKILTAASAIGSSYNISINGADQDHVLRLVLQYTGTATGDFKLSASISIAYMSIDPYTSNKCPQYTGSIKITEFDTQNKVISGSFSGIVCGPTDKTVSGSFNKLKY